MSGQARRRRKELLLVPVLVPLVLYPFAGLVWASLQGRGGLSLAAYGTVFQDPAGRHALWSSLALAAASGVGATLLGVILAGLIFYAPFPGSGAATRFVELAVAFPSFLIAFAIIFLYGSQGAVNVLLMRLLHLAHPPLGFLYGPGGVVLAEVSYYAPFVLRPTLAVLELIQREVMEAAASLGAQPLMVLRRVVLPLALPGIAGSGILCLLLVLNEFGILLVLGSKEVTTLPVTIYGSAMVDLDLRAAAAQAVVMLCLSLGLYLIYRRVAGATLRSLARV